MDSVLIENKIIRFLKLTTEVSTHLSVHAFRVRITILYIEMERKDSTTQTATPNALQLYDMMDHTKISRGGPSSQLTIFALSIIRHDNKIRKLQVTMTAETLQKFMFIVHHDAATTDEPCHGY